jgi:hypothetical protein
LFVPFFTSETTISYLSSSTNVAFVTYGRNPQEMAGVSFDKIVKDIVDQGQRQ